MTEKHVLDLGVAAYLLMHGFQVVGKKGRAIYFQCESKEVVRQIDDLILEYQPPNEFYTFDSCLMFLKKIDNFISLSQEEKSNLKVIQDLGVAAYLLMHEYRSNSLGVKVKGREGKNVYFYCPEDKRNRFDELVFQYLPSQFHSYDSCLMSLKKIGEYSPPRNR